jgi:hypothetical protein
MPVKKDGSLKAGSNSCSIQSNSRARTGSGENLFMASIAWLPCREADAL